MKVLLLNGSPHEKGCTYTALCEVAGALEKNGIETEIFQIGNKPVAGCIGCGSCRKTGRCVFEGGVNEFVEKAKEADGFIFGSPVYYANASGQISSFLDRAFYSNGSYEAFRFKPGAAIAVARRGGTTAALDALNKYFGIAQMPTAGSTYWNMVHGLYAEEAPQDEEGMQTTENKRIFIGRQIDVDEETFEKNIEALDEASRREDKNIRELVHKIVPEYQYQASQK